MEQLIAGDTRKPAAGHLTYSAGSDVPSPWAPMGPNTMNETVWPVTSEVLEDGRLHVGFSYIAPRASFAEKWVRDYDAEHPR